MPKLCYVERTFHPGTRKLIEQANSIIAEIGAQGFSLTLRQLYYQFVARGLLGNDDKNYKRLGKTVSEARMAGLIDWGAIVDRTRNLKSVSVWDDPQSILQSALDSYRLHKWKNQPNYVEAWVEKDALVGVLERVCTELEVPYFSCRGYTSQSEIWGAAQRLCRKLKSKDRVVILHLGDHDPSGIDMSRDIRDRLEMFCRAHVGDLVENLEVRRIALNMDQVRHFNPPPNPAKITDTRAKAYIERWGRKSWELDALSPVTISDLIRDNVNDLVDQELWELDLNEERGQKERLETVIDTWEER